MSDTEIPPEPTPAAPARQPGLIRRVLFWAAGCDEATIGDPRCAVDWNRCSAIGAATLATAAVAAISGGFASGAYLFDGAPVPAAAAGLAWGALILTLDRLMLTSLVKRPDATPFTLLRVAAPRYALAIIIALLVGAPAELLVFRRQLDVQVAVDHAEEVGRQRARVFARYGDIADLATRRDALSQEIEQAHAETQATFRDAQCEGAGDCGSERPGLGPLHAEQMKRFHDLQAGEAAVRARDAAQIAGLEARIAQREAARERDLAGFEDLTRGSDDLMTRLIAMQHLARDHERGAVVSAAETLIRLLLIALEILPITAKLFTRGAYDAAYLAAQEGASAEHDADRDIAVARADERRRRERTVGEMADQASANLARSAAEAAMTSEAWREAQSAMAREILARAVPVARAAAAAAFEDGALAAEVAQTARAARRAGDAEVVAAERDRAAAHANLNGVLDDVESAMRH